MFKTLLYGTLKERKTLENILNKAFKKNNVHNKFYHRDSNHKFTLEFLHNSSFRIYVACTCGTTKYIIKKLTDHKETEILSGKMSFPPTEEEIQERIIYNPDLSNIKAVGECTLTVDGTPRTIPHRDIDYFYGLKKTDVHLKSGEVLKVDESITEIKKQLDKKYFAVSSLATVVNTLNICRTRKSGRKDHLLYFACGDCTFLLGGYYMEKFVKTYVLRLAGQTPLRMYDTT